MRTILHLIQTGGPGGAETVYVNLVRGLDGRRWRSVPVLPNREWMYEQLRAWEPPPIVLPGERQVSLRHLRALREIIRRERVDLIHAHFFASAEIASLIGVLTGTPAVATLHGQTDILGGKRLRLKAALLNRGLGRIAVVSESLRRFFLSATALRPEKLVVIPNGVDLAHFSAERDPSFRREFGIADDAFVVGAVGNLRPAKGYDVLLEAAARLRRDERGIHFVIVGQAAGPLYEELLHKRHALGLDAHVTFTGFRDDVARALAAFDAYVITSRDEGFSLSTVQAMAAALPVVATRCGGPEEIIEDGVTGLLVENASADAVADALRRLRQSPDERALLGRRGRLTAQERYTTAAQVEAYAALYEECLAAPARADSPAPERAWA